MAMKLELNGAIEIIKDRFYFVTLRGLPKNDAHSLYFSIDNELIYEPFFADFGPLNLGHMYSYCMFLDEKLRDEKHSNKKIYHYASNDAAKRTNAVYLICAYSVLFLECTPEEAVRPFSGIHPPLLQYRDPSVGPSTFGLPVLECIRGLVKAQSCGFFNLKTFNVNEYHFYEKIENGDMNWIVPGKFLAFSGPHATHHNETGVRTPVPEDYIPYFKKHSVNTVVRLNKKLYERRRFAEYGVKHVDMYFIDGSCPSESIVQRFLELVENENGAMAVHCKAGLGRTGTLIGCSLIKHYKFTAYEAIAWLRICRPGSVIGPQQHFLVQMQSSLWRSGEVYKRKLAENSQQIVADSPVVSLRASRELTITDYAPEAPTPKGAKSGFFRAGRDKPLSSTGSSNSSLAGVSIGVSASSDDAGPMPSSYASSSSPMQTLSSLTSSPYANSKNHVLSKEKLKADMRMITATLKSIRTSSVTSSPSSSQKEAPHPPPPAPSLYTHTMSTPTHTSSSSAYTTSHTTPTSNYTSSPSSSGAPATVSSPYTPQASSRVMSMTSTKTKAPSGLALQQKKMENQQQRRGMFQNGAANGTSSSSSASSNASSSIPSKQSATPTRTNTVTRVPLASPISLLTFNKPTQSTSSSSSASSSTATTPTHRRTRSSGTLMSASPSSSSNSAATMSIGGHNDTVSSYVSSSPYSLKMHSNTHSNPPLRHTGSSVMSSPSASVLLRSKTPPPRRLDDYSNYRSTGYLDYQQTNTHARYIKT